MSDCTWNPYGTSTPLTCPTAFPLFLELMLIKYALGCTLGSPSLLKIGHGSSFGRASVWRVTSVTQTEHYNPVQGCSTRGLRGAREQFHS